MHTLILAILSLAIVNTGVILFAEIQVRKDMKRFLHELKESGVFNVD